MSDAGFPGGRSGRGVGKTGAWSAATGFPERRKKKRWGFSRTLSRRARGGREAGSVRGFRICIPLTRRGQRAGFVAPPSPCGERVFPQTKKAGPSGRPFFWIYPAAILNYDDFFRLAVLQFDLTSERLTCRTEVLPYVNSPFHALIFSAFRGSGARTQALFSQLPFPAHPQHARETRAVSSSSPPPPSNCAGKFPSAALVGRGITAMLPYSCSTSCTAGVLYMVLDDLRHPMTVLYAQNEISPAGVA